MNLFSSIMKSNKNNSSLTIIAGPCSVNKSNIKQIYQLAKIKAKGKRAIYGTRLVALKSRTFYDPKNSFLGIDAPIFKKNTEILIKGGSSNDLQTPPSVKLAEKIIRKTGMTICSEMMSPLVQMPVYEKPAFKGKLFFWSPAVNQLGWPLLQMAKIAKRNNWLIGVKNGKWVGEEVKKANSASFKGETTMEKTWKGLVTYVQAAIDNIILIHRGVDVAEKGKYRNLPVHQIAKRVKQKTKAKLFFDPSHSLGPAMREKIIPATIKAMRMKTDKKTFLYEGILVEAGSSKTDPEQHITLSELEFLVNKLAEFRSLVPPEQI